MVDGVAQGVTTADMTLYVDTATGNDLNTGLVGFPTKTIQAAVNKVPKDVYHNVTINVAAGTYAENLLIDLNVKDLKAFTIQGSSWTAVTPATGPASGTFTSNNGINQLVLAGATWTVDDLKGKMLKITSGAKSGNYYPIASNTATAVDVGGDASAIGNANFEFATPAAIITKGAGPYSVTVVGYGIGASASSKVFLRNLNIGQTATGSVRGNLFNMAVGVYNCILATGSVFDGLNGAQLYNCYINGGTIVCSILRGSGHLSDCVVNGNTSFYGLLLGAITLSVDGGLIVQGGFQGRGFHARDYGYKYFIWCELQSTNP